MVVSVFFFITGHKSSLDDACIIWGCQEIDNCLMMLVILEVALNGFIVTRGALSWAHHMSDDSYVRWQAHLHLLSLTLTIDQRHVTPPCRWWITWNNGLPHVVHVQKICEVKKNSSALNYKQLLITVKWWKTTRTMAWIVVNEITMAPEYNNNNNNTRHLPALAGILYWRWGKSSTL